MKLQHQPKFSVLQTPMSMSRLQNKKLPFPWWQEKSYHVFPQLQLPDPPRSHWCWATLTSMIWLASGRFPTAADSASQPKVTNWQIAGDEKPVRFVRVYKIVDLDGTVWSQISHICLYCVYIYIYYYMYMHFLGRFRNKRNTRLTKQAWRTWRICVPIYLLQSWHLPEKRMHLLWVKTPQDSSWKGCGEGH